MLSTGCGDKTTESEDSGFSGADGSSNDDGSPDDDGADADAVDDGTVPDDTGTADEICRQLSVNPTSVLLDASDGITVEQTVILTNTCAEDADPLEITNVILADETGAFTVSSAPPYTLNSGMSVTIELSFQPIDTETRTAFAIVVSNDPNKPNASIGIVGRPPSDQDGDGFITTLVGGEDCDDTDSSVFPGAEETWYDGIDSNCDGLNDYDADLDGFLSLESESGDDCDDTLPEVHPGSEDIWYDGIDSDCAGNDDFDQDGDGYASAEFDGDDCDDLDTHFSPGAAEIWYDGIDNNCDGLSDYDADYDGHDHPTWGGDDCNEEDPTIYPGAPEVDADGIDQDCNGIADDGTTASDDDLDGYSEDDGDCDDSNPDIHPEAEEICGDGLDNNCDDSADGPGATGCTDMYVDNDGDGAGTGDPMCLCEADEEYTAPLGGDCNDLDVAIGPTEIDTWYDGIDTNCDGWSDFDADGDGHNHDSWGGADCDDTDALTHPEAVEIYYDGIDTNCDGLSDYDADGDGHIHEDHGGDDCDDTDPLTSPTATDTMDLTDQDCDGFIDEDLILPGDVLVSEVMATPDSTPDWYGEYFEIQNTTINPIDLLGWVITDADGESFTIEESLVIDADGFLVFGVSDDESFNGGVTVDYVYSESEFSLHYSVDRILLNLQDTTIGSVDYTPSWPTEAGRAMSLDTDFAHPDYTGMSQVWCPSTSSLPMGDHGTPGAPNDPCMEMDWDGDEYTELMGDCDDFSTLASPGVAEACDEIDNDCDGYIDEGGADGASYWYADSDADGYGHLSSAVFSCSPPENFVADNSDCDDLDPERNPGIEEVWYDGVDSDCDGWSDFDLDFDDFDSVEYGGEDCDDDDSSINPMVLDEWYDGIDSDCGGEDDYDADLDGYRSDLHGGLDCADYDPGISPASPEYWNATDDNCLGGVDDFMVMGFSSLVITAEEEIHLGDHAGISVGDMDGDGITDLVIAADAGGYDAEGRAWILNGAEPWSLVGNPNAVSSAQFSGAAAANYMGTLGARQVDHVGSASADLLIAGTDELGGYAMCLLDGDILDGPVNCGDGVARWTGANGAYARVINHLDIDGDGLPEIIYSDSWEGIGATGMIYVFNGSSIGGGDFDITDDKDWRIDGRHAYDYVGSQVGGGDINDDGYDDLMIGAYGDDHPDSKTGSVFVFVGGAETPPTIRTAQFDKDIHIYGNEMNAMIGKTNPSEIGDINGDGAADLVVSSPGTESAHIFYSSAELMDGTHSTHSADTNIFGTDEADNFGTGLALADVDSDGFDDLIVGAPDEESPGIGDADGPGHAYLFFGGEIFDYDEDALSPEGGAYGAMTSSDAGAHFYGRATGDNFGAVIRSGFDMNGDGRSDLAIAAPGNTLSTDNAGQIHLLLMPGGR